MIFTWEMIFITKAMKPIEPNSVLTFVSCFVFLLWALFIIAYLFVKWGKRSDYPRYLERIIYLERLIDKCNIDSGSFDYILKEFENINQYRKKDLRRNQVAFVRFSLKFKDEWKKRIEESC